MDMTLLIILGVLVGLGAVGFMIATALRRVVPTNEVHIVQSTKETKSYGKDTGNGNTYYEIPSYIPKFGVTKVVLPVSNFNVELDAYEAYDSGRLPLVLDVMAFFRISEPNIAASRISSFQELQEQLTAIVQGAARTILASNDIEEIMQGRGKFGQQFTEEVKEQLTNWGVEAVKNIELMDIRDSKDSKVISNIMDKKKSLIEMESRTEVAKNKRAAEIAEVEAKRDVDLQKQTAAKAVGIETALTEREVNLAKETAAQQIKEQQKLTKEKEMAVTKVESVRKAEIAKEVQVVAAQQEKETVTIKAEGALEAKRKESEGISLEGKAKADAQTAMLMAPVNAQTALAKEIGENQSYQTYLITIEKVKASRDIGIEQAKALAEADVKVISNTGSPTTGITNVMDLFTSEGGTKVGSMLEALRQTPTGEALVNAVLPTKATGTDGGRADGANPLSLAKDKSTPLKK